MPTELDRERQHEEDLQRIRGFRLIDDDFMTVCFADNIECTELLLRIVMDKPDLIVRRVQTQKLMKNLQGRSVCLDIDAVDSENKEYDVEVQRADAGASPRRARFHSSLLDANVPEVGKNFENLPETCVIFITEHDVLNGNQPLYVIDRCIKGLGKPFNDGAHIIYVNGEDRNSATDLGLLMHDFFCVDPKDMHYKELADRANYFKNSEEGVTAMCKAMEDMRNEVALRNSKEIALRLINMGKLSHEEIAEASGLALEVIKELAQQKTA
ncbi:MAG: hypothetical protein J5449_04155 [Oscillospiraceae bacterium]|nr:hypothetical protein [Oscillospiraceae bacterium]